MGDLPGRWMNAACLPLTFLPTRVLARMHRYDSAMGVSGDRHPYLEVAHPIALAHRGGGEPALENTWSAFRNAVALGYGYLETDAWATADGQVVLFHDEDLGRVSDRTGRIGDLPYTDVAQARIAGTQQIPLLSDVLAEWGEVRLNIDLKCDEVVEPFVR